MPKDPVMLLSYINLKLRDYYSSIDDLCNSEAINKEELINTLASIDYSYDSVRNQFI